MHKKEILEKHFFPFVRKNELFRTADEHSNIIVYEVNQFRILTFDSLCEQSKVHMDNPLYLDHEYIQAMLLPLLQVNPQHVTLLGLGGGSLANCLYHIYSDVKLLVVEWREAIIDIAYRYFDLPRDERLEVKHCDAKTWLEKAADHSTDLILSDLYHAHTMHDVQLEKDFFTNCHRVLRDKGWLSLNYHKLPSAESLALNHLCHLFPAIFMLQVNTDNWVLVASKHETTLEAMLGAASNNRIPAALSTSLQKLQGRLTRVNRNKNRKA